MLKSFTQFFFPVNQVCCFFFQDFPYTSSKPGDDAIDEWFGDETVQDTPDERSFSVSEIDDILYSEHGDSFISPNTPMGFRRDIPLEPPLPETTSMYPQMYPTEPKARIRMHKVPYNKHRKFKTATRKKLTSANPVANAMHNVLVSSPVNNGSLWDTLNRVLTFTASRERRHVPHVGVLDLLFPIAYLLPDKSCFICLVCRVSKKGKAPLDSTYVL